MKNAVAKITAPTLYGTFGKVEKVTRDQLTLEDYNRNDVIQTEKFTKVILRKKPKRPAVAK